MPKSLFKLKKIFLLKRKLWHWYFPVNLVKFLRAPFLQNTSGGLLLSVDEAFWENSQRFLAVHYFHKKLHLRCLTEF